MFWYLAGGLGALYAAYKALGPSKKADAFDVYRTQRYRAPEHFEDHYYPQFEDYYDEYGQFQDDYDKYPQVEDDYDRYDHYTTPTRQSSVSLHDAIAPSNKASFANTNWSTATSNLNFECSASSSRVNQICTSTPSTKANNRITPIEMAGGPKGDVNKIQGKSDIVVASTKKLEVEKKKAVQNRYRTLENKPELDRMLYVFLTLNIQNILKPRKEDVPDFIGNMDLYFPVNEYERKACLPQTYRNGDDYKRSFLPYILFNAWAQFHQDARNSEVKTVFEFKVLRWEESNQPGLKCASLQSIMPILNKQDKLLKVGYSLCMMYSPRPCLVYTHSRERCKDNPYVKYCVTMTEKAWQKVQRFTILRIEPVYYFRTIEQMVQTLDSLEDYSPSFYASIQRPNIEICRLNLKGKYSLFEEDRFNHKQREAIVACLNSLKVKGPKIQLIQGPPGTGKTHTIIGLVNNILHCFTSPGDRLRVLICAPSNGAVDNIAIKLMDQQHAFLAILGRQANMLRLGSSLSPKINPIVKKICADKFLNLDLKKMDIVLSTLGSCHSMLKYTPVLFSCVIIDECAQCSEPELLLPMIHDVSDKMILVGDTKQLPATVICRKSERVRFGRSLFERFEAVFAELKASNIKLMLDTQFRMKLDIARWPSSRFYNGQLKTQNKSGENANIPLKPYLVFDVCNSREKTSDCSKMNEAEAEFVYKLVKSIVKQIGCPNFLNMLWDPQKRGKLPRISIGIITFYNGQKKLLRDKFKLNADVIQEYLKIDTVDGFQGREQDIIILSCVRTDTVGFVRSAQRANVALTRSKSALFVCLKAQAFQKDSLWRSMLKNANKLNVIQQVKFQIGVPELNKLIAQ